MHTNSKVICQLIYSVYAEFWSKKKMLSLNFQAEILLAQAIAKMEQMMTVVMESINMTKMITALITKIAYGPESKNSPLDCQRSLET
jgi:hypothetical protein